MHMLEGGHFTSDHRRIEKETGETAQRTRWTSQVPSQEKEKQAECRCVCRLPTGHSPVAVEAERSDIACTSKSRGAGRIHGLRAAI
jgi:hypothetical protein